MNFKAAWGRLQVPHTQCPYRELDVSGSRYDHVVTWEDQPDGYQTIYYVSYIKENIICLKMERLNEDGVTYYPSIGAFMRSCPEAFQERKATKMFLGDWSLGSWFECLFVPARIMELL